jgi:hypothetical protein
MSEVRTLAAILVAVQPELCPWPHHAQHFSALFGALRGALKWFERAVAPDSIAPKSGCTSKPWRVINWGRYPGTVALLKRRILGNSGTHASRVLFAASLWPDGPYRRDEKRCGSIVPIRSSIAAMCCLQEPADFDLVIEGRRKVGIEQ